MNKTLLSVGTILIILSSFIIHSCKDNKKPTDSISLDFSDFRGITATDSTGSIISHDGDWCLPGDFTSEFGPAYPNPAKDSCTIRVVLPALARIKVEIYNHNKTLVATLIDGRAPDYIFNLDWNLKNSSGNRVPDGLYRVFLIVDQFQCHGDIQVQSTAY